MNRNAKKKDVSDKVKEIRQRQENWLKQREASQNQEKVSQSKPVAPHPSVQAKTQPVRESDTLPQVLASSKSQARFKNWMKAKQTDDTSTNDYNARSDWTNGAAGGQIAHNKPIKYDASNYTKIEYGENCGDNSYNDAPYRDHKGSREVNILRVPSSRKTEFATPEPGWNSDDETGEITAAQLMSAEDFDSVADNIIARVKGDMLLDKSAVSGHKENLRSDHRASASKNVGSTDRTTRTSEMSSHVCPSCDQLMVPPACSPVLLIPCGHTLCKRCAQRVQQCVQCSCPVQSSTANIMLQQIIANFQDKHVSRTTHSGPKLQTKNRYKEEYQNLKTRQEILHGECESISKNIQKLTRKLAQEHSQVENILQDEKKVEAKIVALQQSLLTLVEHRTEYEHNCEHIQSQTKQERNRLSLAKDTLASIQREMEKVKLLAEND